MPASESIRRNCLLLAMGYLLLLPGCGSNQAQVSGKVTLDEEPLKTGTIVFQGEGLPMATGQIKDGSYVLNTGTERGLPPGKYQVTVSAYQSKGDGDSELVPKLLTPQRYNNPETSEFEADVQPGSNTFDYALKN